MILTGAAQAQESGRGFLDNLFNRGEPAQSRMEPNAQVPQTNENDLAVRVDRLENALRQVTGQIEELQHRNQQLEMKIERLQEYAGSRSPQPGAKEDAARLNTPPGATLPARRGDAFDPAAHPDAPGAPRILGSQSFVSPRENSVNRGSGGVSGGRAAGAPLDLANAAGPRQLATLPPSARPQDEYDLAYGYVLHKDYALAEQAFRDFLARYPNEPLVPDAQYWLGEALFQQQRYREAAESFLAVSTKHERAEKAPESLLRLGQSLVVLQKKDAACATFAEVNRKYPQAPAGVKRSVAQEFKRVHC